MATRFVVNFVNNTSFKVTLTATIADNNRWQDPQERPDQNIKGAVGPFSSSQYFREKMDDSEGVMPYLIFAKTVPFTVVATFEGHAPISFQLDGCNVRDLVNDGEIKVIEGSTSFSVFQITYPDSDTASGLKKMTIYLTPFVSLKNWMGKLIEKNNALTLTDLTLPGTHDSGTYGGTHEEGTQCQTMDFRTQLESGIRFLDLRLKRYDDSNDLGIFHQAYTQNLWFRQQVLPAIAQFLAENPTECVIICVNHAMDGEVSFDAMLHEILMQGMPTNKVYDHNNTWRFSLKLSSLQGCVVLMRRDREMTSGINATAWPDNPDYIEFDNGTILDEPGTIKFYLQDAYSTPLAQISPKWEHVRDHLKRAKAHQSAGWFINFTSASSSTAPAKPWFPWGYATAEGTGTAQWGINTLLSRFLASDCIVGGAIHAGRLGTIAMDYPEYPGNNLLSHLLIARNERAVPLITLEDMTRAVGDEINRGERF